jgi:hypothetical protein
MDALPVMAALLRTLALSPISTFFRLMTVPIAAWKEVMKMAEKKQNEGEKNLA